MAYVSVSYLKHKKEYTKLIGLFWFFVIIHFVLSAAVDKSDSPFLIGVGFSFLIIPIIYLTNIIFYTNPAKSLKMKNWILYQLGSTIFGSLLYILVPDDLFPGLLSSKFTLLTLPIVITQSIPCLIMLKYILRSDTLQMKSEEIYRIFILIYLVINVANSFFFCFGRLAPSAQEIGYTVALIAFASGSLIVVAMNMMISTLEDSLRSERVKILRGSLLNNIAHDSREGILSMGEGADFLLDKIDRQEVDLNLFAQTLKEIKDEASRVSKAMIKALENERKITIEHILEEGPVSIEYYQAKIEYKLRGVGLDPSSVISNELLPNALVYTDRDLAYDSVIMNLLTNAIKHTSELRSLRVCFYEEDNHIIFSVENVGEISEDTVMLSRRGIKPRGRLGLTNLFFISEALGMHIEITGNNGTTKAKAFFSRPRIFHSEVSLRSDSLSHH